MAQSQEPKKRSMNNIEESNQEDLKELEEEETSTNDETEEEQEETVEEIKEKLAKAEELAKNQKIRAEKAEKLAKKAKPAEQTKEIKKESTLSVKDSARLQQADIPVDDWDEVISYAEFKGIEISEALKSSVVKATLGERAEERKTANATNTGKGKRGAEKISGEKLLEQAQQGKAPESDAEIAALAAQRYKPKD